MSRLRAALAAAMLLFGGAVVASAQQPVPRARAHATRKVSHALMKGLQLSDAERANLKAVRAKYAAQRKALRTAERPQRMSLRQSERNDIRAALSGDNRAKFDANAAALRERILKRPKPINP